MVQVDFGYETEMVALTAGQPPLTVTDFYFFFPSGSNQPAVWSNLNTWDMTNARLINYMFAYITVGEFDLRGWSLPNVIYTAGAFENVAVPIIGNLTDLTASSMQYASFMFNGYAGGPLTLSNLNTGQLIIALAMFQGYDSAEVNLSNIDTSNLVNAESMFQFTSNFPNLDISSWNTGNLENIKNMFFGCKDIKPVYTFWDLSSITSCDYTIQSSNFLVTRGISLSTDYDAILNSFDTNTTSLICNWGTAGGFRQPINSFYTPAGSCCKNQFNKQRMDNC